MLSSVDSLESANGGIIIQILGELSNHGAPSQKFAQTFFLAEQLQPKGYYALNNIFRYIKEDIDSDLEDAEPASPNELELPMSSHDGQHHTTGLTNGFHSAAHSLYAPDAPPQTVALPFASNSIGSPMETQNEMEHTAAPNVLEDYPETIPQITAPPAQVSTGIDTVSEPMEIVSQETIPAGEKIESGTPRESVPTLPAEVPTQVPEPARPIPKTWATLAATNADKWHVQVEQKTAASGSAPLPKSNGNLPAVRKEVTKIQGILVS
jgi:hypothetical protein